MSAIHPIVPDELFRLIGTLTCPVATTVRAADTARLDLSPEAPDLFASPPGLSRMYPDDLAQLEARLPLYDAFYRWCRDATGETLNWPSHGQNKIKSKGVIEVAATTVANDWPTEMFELGAQ